MWALIALLGSASAQNLTVHGTVLAPVPGTYYENGIGAPAVAYDPARDLYVMLFETKIPNSGAWFDGSAFAACPPSVRVWGLGRATSNDGLTWTVDADPALMPIAGTDRGCVVAHPVMLFDGWGYSRCGASEAQRPPLSRRAAESLGARARFRQAWNG